MNNTIPRIDIEALQSDLTTARGQLIKDAREKLGYRTSRPLLEALANLGIAPFRTSSVVAYKESLETESMRSGTRDWIVWVVVNACVLSSSIFGADYFHGAMQVISVALIFAGGISSLASLILMNESIGQGVRTIKRWETCSIQSYLEAIPDYALNKAMQIHDTLGSKNLSLQVCYLNSVTDHKAPVRDPDPFLVVSNGSETYYIEQWNEKDLPRLEL